MPLRTFDYRPPMRRRTVRRGRPSVDLPPFAVSVAVVAAVNAWLVWIADKSWASWLWVFFLIPIANVILMIAVRVVLPSVGRLLGISVNLPGRWVAWCCLAAVFGDAVMILGLVHGS